MIFREETILSFIIITIPLFCLGGVVVCLQDSRMVDRGLDPGRVKLKTIKLVSVAPLCLPVLVF